MQGQGGHQGGATVVISLRVRAGHERDYERWQAEIDAAAEDFEGFEGSEVLPPRPGVQDEWVVVYRFDSAHHLTEWMRSEVRAALLQRAAPYLEHRSEHVVATPRGSARPVTVVVSRRVEPGHEHDFERWQRGITKAAEAFAGFLGSESFRPVPGVQDDWVIVFRFASPATLQAWLDSPERESWIDEARPWAQQVAMHTVGGGLGGWFPLGPTAAAASAAPAKWKQSLAVLLALYPTVMLLTMFVSPRLDALVPQPVSMFLSNLASVAILTWLMMPATTRLLRPWLRSRDLRATVLGAGLVAAACGAMIMAFMAAQ
ncbi:MAG: antibiotic biosynthesis monooxygenase [Nannocystaceae bacterium]